jgi:acyl-CoA synthetase (AMP-forming)/AMP-acid ligase II
MASKCCLCLFDLACRRIDADGEKTVPGPIESVLLAHPRIMGAVVFGRERNQTGVLIEPTNALDLADAAERVRFLNDIWCAASHSSEGAQLTRWHCRPAVEHANADAPAFARIWKEMILFASPDKPLPRAAKSTVNRKAAL